eukprot:3727137-Rhodomonas_salina.4
MSVVLPQQASDERVRSMRAGTLFECFAVGFLSTMLLCRLVKTQEREKRENKEREKRETGR